MATKKFPQQKNASVKPTFNIHIVSEGYTSEKSFDNDCKKLREKLFKVSPFNMVRYYPRTFSIYTHFVASSFPGPEIKSNAGDYVFTPGLTPINSVFNSADQILKINKPALNTLLSTLSVKLGSKTLSLIETIGPRLSTGIASRGLVFILLPEQTSLVNNSIVEMEDRSNDPYFVASSANLNFEMTLARGIAAAIGLEDEFSLANISPTLQSEKDRINNAPNLVLFDTNSPIVPGPYILAKASRLMKKGEFALTIGK